ncbi:hypothetical protein ACVME8_001968 [Bradyrhizobium diazoefficiens]
MHHDDDAIIPTPGEFVCGECITEPALKDLIEDCAESLECSFCERQEATPIAAPVHVIAERVLDGLRHLYDDANNGLGWEGGFVGETFNTFELIEEHAELSEVWGRLHDRLTDLLPDIVWSDKDPYGPRPRDVYKWSWDEFAETVKHKRRYFFERPVSTGLSERLSAVELLSSVATSAYYYGLIRTLPAGQRLYRCRMRSDVAQCFLKPSELGAPPADIASQSRMSPAGIPMFYGAERVSTAVLETVDPGKHFAVGCFYTTKPLTVLDLTEVPRVSIFSDEELRPFYHWASFMHDFIADFKKPVDRDGEAKHFEYIPTQIVTEFFRSPPSEDLPKVDAIRYRSTRNNGPCWVVFADQSDVSDQVGAYNLSSHGSRLLALSSMRHPDKALPGSTPISPSSSASP